MPKQSDTKRLAKNTLFMYFRMGFLMLITLYTSRVVLQQLGVEDYGIYNVVGSIVTMFISLKSIFASSTQRFLNYEMGRGNDDKLQLIYTMSSVINAIIAIVFFVIVEAIGLWFLEFKINIDPSRLYAARWVFQFSVLSTIISIMSIPLDACIIAHERMDFYAYISIFEGLARLGICYLLKFFDIDKLILYGFLMMLISIGVCMANLIFCVTNFNECHIKKIWDRHYFIKMTSFAGWAFFGNTANMLSQSGLNLVLNVFGGPVVNAARGITYQVNNALNQFISNVIIVVKPFAIKTYASGQIDKALMICHLSSKLYFTIQLCIVVAITFFADYILELWLGQVPEYTVIFLDLVMIQSLIRSLHMPIGLLFSGEGNIKYYQIIEGLVLSLPVLLAYILLDQGYPYYSAFIGLIVCELIHIASIAILASHVCHLRLLEYSISVVFPCLLCGIVYLLGFYINYNTITALPEKLLGALFTVLISALIMFFFGISKHEKQLLLTIIKKHK